MKKKFDENNLTIKQAAKVLGFHHDTLQYWEEKKLIPLPRRNPENNYRVYNATELKEIAVARGAYEVDIDNAILQLKINSQ